MRGNFSRWAIVCLVLIAGFTLKAEDAKKKYKVLFVTQSKGFMHGSVNRNKLPLAPAEVALQQIGQNSGLFEVECTQDASILTADKLKELDVVFFYTTGQLPITEENFTAFLEWLKAGHAFCGAHSATDTYGNFKPYYELINGTFNGHPWGSGTKITVTNHEPEHPAVKMYPAEFQWVDEIYQYKNYDPKAVRVLLSLNMEKTNPKMPYHVPISWVREYGQGRVFYTNLGHNEKTWADSKFQEHILMGIRWALKLEQGNATPNPDVQEAEANKAASAVLEELKPYLKESGQEDAIGKAEKALKEDSAAGRKLVGELRGAKADADAYNGAVKQFEQLKPWFNDGLKDSGVSGADAVAKLEKLAKDDKGAFRRLIEASQRAKNEKDEAKKKDAITKLAADLKK
jgi:type 1 glutamine amidotransferase